MKFVRNRRAISNVITAAMLLTGVAIMGSAIVAWSQGNLKVFETSLANTSSDLTNKNNENLSIENVVFCKASAPFCSGYGYPTFIGLNVTLTNVGTVSVNVTAIQLNNTVYTSTAYITYPSNHLPLIINPHKSYVVFMNKLSQTPVVNVWNSGSVTTITVTTARGSIFTTQAAPP